MAEKVAFKLIDCVDATSVANVTPFVLPGPEFIHVLAAPVCVKVGADRIVTGNCKTTDAFVALPNLPITG